MVVCIDLAINSSQLIVFLFRNARRLLNEQKTMCCDRSAYYQKAIKATARQFKIYAHFLWLFLLFGRLDCKERNFFFRILLPCTSH